MATLWAILHGLSAVLFLTLAAGAVVDLNSPAFAAYLIAGCAELVRAAQCSCSPNRSPAEEVSR